MLVGSRVSDLGTRELHMKGGILQKLNEVTGQIMAHRMQRPIDYYYNKDFIEQCHYDAAMALDRDHEKYLLYRGLISQSLGLGKTPPNMIRSCLNFERGETMTTEEIIEEICKGAKRYVECMHSLSKAERKFIHAIVIHDQYLSDLQKNKAKFTVEDLPGMTFSLKLNAVREVLDQMVVFYRLRSYEN